MRAKVVKIVSDGGYSGENFATAVMTLLNAEVEIVTGNELHTFIVLPKRWIVERSLGWLDHFRRLWKNCERKLYTVHQMVALAFISFCYVDTKHPLIHCSAGSFLKCSKSANAPRFASAILRG